MEKLVKTGVKGVGSVFVKSGSSVALPVWLAEELYSAEDVLEGPVVKEVKGKAERRLINLAVGKESVEESAEKLMKMTQEDDVEKSFEVRRARKLAKVEKSGKAKEGKSRKVKQKREMPAKLKGTKSVKA
jgi:hypothetical protein